MIAGLMLGAPLGLGLWLIVTGQPVGRPRPDLGQRLARLTAQGRTEQVNRSRSDQPVFKSSALETLLRPLLDDAGRLIGRLLGRLGVRTRDLDRRLALSWPGMTASQFYGQKLASGLVFLAMFPLMNLLGVHPFGPWPVWTWLVGFGAGFATPDWVLAARVERRRVAVLLELPTAVDLLAIAASAGLSPEHALLEASHQTSGPLGDGLREVAREAGLGTISHAAGLRALADREGLAELRVLADTWRTSQEQGLPLSGAMLALAETVRDRWRTHLLAEGGKSTVRMLFPVAVFIFPVFLVVLLYPAGVQLLGLGG
ncbi:MAG: type II secretion system F family protein [Dehalococcoidia bacterium]